MTEHAVRTSDPALPAAESSTALATPPRKWLPWLFAVLCFAAYAAWSLWRQQTFQSTGYDLGIFEQVVRSYAEGHLPTADLKGPSYPVLGDHFSPILAVLAPFYLLWRSPDTLLLAQAALLGVSAVPVVRLASTTFGRWSTVAIGIAYGLSWGLLGAVNFDFHEVCFAVPLIAFAAERLVHKQWGAALAWSVPLVLVKEDLPITVVAVGGYLFANRARRLGLATIVFGVACAAVILLVILPAANPGGHYAYWDNLQQHGSFTLAALAIRALTLFALLAPTAFLALRSPIVLLALPTLGWRFLSSNSSYWGWRYHYSAILMPIVFLALADAARRLRGTERPRLLAWCRAVPIAAIVLTVIFTFTLGELDSGQIPWSSAQRATAQRVLAMIPDGATVAASNRLAPHLTNRCQVYTFPFEPSPDASPEWIVAAVPSNGWPITPAAEAAQLAALEAHQYRVVVDAGNVVLLHRNGLS